LVFNYINFEGNLERFPAYQAFYKFFTERPKNIKKFSCRGIGYLGVQDITSKLSWDMDGIEF
jgi:hypothetical protein